MRLAKPMTALLTLLLAAPAVAQERGHGDRRSGETQGRAVTRGESGRERVGPRVESRREGAPAVVGPRREVVGPRAEARAVPASPRAVPRGEVIAPRVERPVVVAPRGVRPYVAPSYVRPYYGSPYYGRPYYVVRPYAFRPRFRLGLGIFVGYPVAYSYAYPYPVPVYGYGAPPAPVVVGPTSPYYGGVSLEFSPGGAAVYVDGSYAGVVDDFDGARQPLNLTAGTHRIEITAAGYEPMTFDVTVQPGQLIPYRGDLVPIP
jgi:PEGA domain-containing protein